MPLSSGIIGGQYRPMTVNRQRRVGFVPGEHKIDDLARGAKRRILQWPLRVDRRVTCRDQQPVAFAQRDFEPLGKSQHHVAAR
jgi:hypothetical protein